MDSTSLDSAWTPFLDSFVKMDEKMPYMKVYYLIILLNTLTSYFVVYRTDLIVAHQKKYIVTRVNLITTVLLSL